MRRTRLSGLTWIGLVVAAAGWLVLIFGETATALLARAMSPDNFALVPAVERVALAQALLLTGFGLAILGALRQGFGALNRFFDAVLGNLAPPQAKLDRATAEFEAALAQPAAPPARAPEALRKPPRPPVRPPGVANYVIRDDGTAEVETLLGVRRFNSEKEAREFLGA